jgi:hypothetical protein
VFFIGRDTALQINWYFKKDRFVRKMNHSFKEVICKDCPEGGFPGTFWERSITEKLVWNVD